MSENSWVEEFSGAVTVCDTEGRIVEMNGQSADVFSADGGAKLIGTKVLDCHPEPSRSKLKNMMDERRTNVYTIQKNGRKKLIYQAPWYRNGLYAGFVELSLEIPSNMLHFNRD
jgi:transcriptional regulator with PAS, ATPase and Fis domain